MAFFDKMLNAMRLNSDEDDDEFYNDEYLDEYCDGYDDGWNSLRKKILGEDKENE